MLSRTILQRFLSRVKEEVEAERSKGIELVPQHFIQWRVTEFKYGARGVTKVSRRGKRTTEHLPSLHEIFFAVYQKIQSSDEYSSTVDSLLEHIGGTRETVAHKLQEFLSVMISLFSANSTIPKSVRSDLIKAFLKELEGKPVGYAATVHMNGVVILSPKIEFTVEKTLIGLRRTYKKDLETKELIEIQGIFPKSDSPDCILDISLLGNRIDEVQLRIRKAVTILRLFGVGSVHFSSYQLRTDSLISPEGRGQARHFGGEEQRSLEKYVIRKRNVERLEQYWRTLSKVLPEELYQFEKVFSQVTIAYDRYSDALLSNGIFERRVANAVMGLEGLYLTESEIAELSYRLSIRISKVMSLQGHNPEIVRDIVKMAYGIRSSFVHGGALKAKQKQKIIDSYESQKHFIRLLLEYLRLSILIWVASKDRKGLPTLIDAALIDVRREKELSRLLDQRTFRILTGC